MTPDGTIGLCVCALDVTLGAIDPRQVAPMRGGPVATRVFAEFILPAVVRAPVVTGLGTTYRPLCATDSAVRARTGAVAKRR